MPRDRRRLPPHHELGNEIPILASLRAQCSDRGHSLHLFGDIVDTFWVAQIDRCDLMSGKENSEVPVGTERANSEPLAAEGLRDFPEPPLEADIGLRRGDRTDELALVVLHRRKAIRHRALARSIAACRHIEVQRLVRPVEIVDGSPFVERALDIIEVAITPERKDLGLQATVEAFVLAAALRMVGPAVNRSDAELQKPDRQRGPGVFKGDPLSTNIASGSP